MLKQSQANQQIHRKLENPYVVSASTTCFFTCVDYATALRAVCVHFHRIAAALGPTSFAGWVEGERCTKSSHAALA